MRGPRSPLPLLTALLCAVAPLHRAAARPAPRLRGAIDDGARTALAGARPPLAHLDADAGRLPRGARLQGVTLVLSRTSAQEEELRALVAAQHDPASPRYHRWLTPEAFGDRFGVADEDLAALRAWLERHGLRVEGVSRARDRLRVSGTAAQLEAAFGTELHAYRLEGEAHFAPAGDATLPTAVAPLVAAITGLSSFRPRPHLRPRPAFTSSLDPGRHFVTPGDVDVIYGVAPLRTAGLDGTGVEIAVVGQSAVSLTDLENFRRAAGLPPRDPELVLVPGTGAPVHLAGDEGESDLDLEWAGAMAPGATLRFVYVGAATNKSVWDSIEYAVENDVAPIVSVSYGICEPALSASQYAAMEAVLAQAAAQGQSIVAASGDDGSQDCLRVAGLGAGTRQAVAVDYPASSAHVTGVGGSELTAAAVAPSLTTTQYWTATTGSDVVASARSYIPEQVWNDGPTHGAGGGGVSVRTPRPAWQAGVPGLPAGARRLVPDLSLDASGVNAPLVLCSSDPAGGGSQSSCSVGFRDAVDGNLTVGGGTSFGAPMFAGMLALVEQRLGAVRLGVVAPALYRLASSASAYAAAFHDVTLGGNPCTSGATCVGPATVSYAAGPGYDLASGLGSIDLSALLDAWPPFAVTATDVGVAPGETGTSTLTVQGFEGYAGEIAWTLRATPALGEGCLSAPHAVVTGSDPVRVALTIQARTDACAGGAVAAGTSSAPPRGAMEAAGRLPGVGALVAAALFGLAAAGQARKRRRPLAVCAAVALAAGVGLAACNGGGSSGGGPVATTYAVEVVGADTADPAITASTTLTLTVR